MKRILLAAGAALLALYPAALAVGGSTFSAHNASVRVPSQAAVVDDNGRHGNQIQAGDDKGGLRKHTEAGDNQGGLRSQVQASAQTGGVPTPAQPDAHKGGLR
jgi:hypothetical protein